MAIRTGQIPPAAIEALRQGLGQMRGLPQADVSAFEAAEEGVQEGVPHETFHLGLDAIRAHRGLAAAEPVGWRYLLAGHAAEPTVAAEVMQSDAGFTFAGLNDGPFVKQMLDAMRKANVQGDYEPRLLRVPAVYVVAAWLKDSTGNNDLFIPLDPSNPALEPGRVYNAKEFEQALVKAADEMAEATRPDEDRGPRAP